MRTKERILRILKLAGHKHEALEIKEIAKRLGISYKTAQRNCLVLFLNKTIIRACGGYYYDHGARS